MCLAIPGKVIEITEVAGMKMGKVDYGETTNEVCLEYVPEITVGQYTIVHAGFAISILNEEEAMKSIETWREMAEKVAAEGGSIFLVESQE
jgi:hydrogenase expression/formation protein HypC